MRDSYERLFRAQFDFLKRQFLQDGELPFTDVLSRETVMRALDTIDIAWNERIYTPLVTLWVFLGQVISADHSCCRSVARLIVHRVSRGLSPWSSKTGASGCLTLSSSLLLISNLAMRRRYACALSVVVFESHAHFGEQGN